MDSMELLAVITENARIQATVDALENGWRLTGEEPATPLVTNDSWGYRGLLFTFPAEREGGPTDEVLVVEKWVPVAAELLAQLEADGVVGYDTTPD